MQFPVQIALPSVRHGNELAGWWICPQGIARDSVVYSVGIGTDISFDLTLVETYGLTVHAFDPTPASIEWLKAQPLPSGFKWYGFGVAAYDGRAAFFPPANPQWVSHTMVVPGDTRGPALDVEVRRIATIMHDLGHDRIDVLKLDVEGAEYDVLEDLVVSGIRPRQLLVEFHHRFKEIGIERTRRTIDRLNAAGYRIYYGADNGEEYSFVWGG